MPLSNPEPKHPGNPAGSPHTLVRDPRQRKQIHTQKQTKVLHWLKSEIYSSPEILGLVLGLNSRQSVHKALTAMQGQNLIRSARVEVMGGYQTLWGITEHGQAIALDPSKNEMLVGKVFAGRVSAARLRHILGLQKMKWQAMQAGWSGWKNCDRGIKPEKRGEKPKHRPDALAINPAGRAVALELELTFKTVKRYAEEVIPVHLRQICSDNQYQHVLWVCPSAEDVKRMKTLIAAATERLRQADSSLIERLQEYEQETGGLTIFRMGTAEEWTQEWEGQVEDRSQNLSAFLWTRFQEAAEGNKDLDAEAQEQQAWMAATDHGLIQQTLSEYKQALQRQSQAEEARRMQETRATAEAKRRYAEELAARQEAERRANSFLGKVSKVFGG